MGYGSPATFVLLFSAFLLPLQGFAAGSSSASASARITLTVTSRAQLRPAEEGGGVQLCLERIPGPHIVLLGDSRGQTGRSLPGRHGNNCLPVSVTEQVEMVMIVAQ